MLSAKHKGILAMIASAFGFALMALCVRLADDYGGPVSSFQKSFFRNLIALLIALFAVIRSPLRRPSEAVPTRRGWALLGLRSLLGTIGIFANFYALSHIPIAEGQTLNKTAPFFTVLFAWAFIKERAGVRQILTLLIAFAGVLLIVKPGFAGEAAFPLEMGLLGGVCAGGAYACVRAMRKDGVDPAFIIFVFSVFSCVASLPFIVFDFAPMAVLQILILFGAGIGAAIGQFGVTLAYGYAAPREIAVYDYTNILFTAAFGYLFFTQLPDLWSVLGFIAILLAACLLRKG